MKTYKKIFLAHCARCNNVVKKSRKNFHNLDEVLCVHYYMKMAGMVGSSSSFATVVPVTKSI